MTAQKEKQVNKHGVFVAVQLLQAKITINCRNHYFVVHCTWDYFVQGLLAGGPDELCEEYWHITDYM